MFNFKRLKGKRVSVLITGKGGNKETYSGVITDVEANYIILQTLPSPHFDLDQFIIRVDIIESIWVFKEKKGGN